MAQAARGRGSDLDPDELAVLERERDFLLRSLDDLDAEHQAGDLEDHDFEALGDDYTRRLAEVARSIEERRQAFDNVESKLSGRQRLLTIVAILVVATIAGVLLARASGFRSPNDSVSGDIRQSSTGLLAEADTLTREGQWPQAIEIYDQVLDISPSNVEALTYRGWLTARLGDAEAGIVDIAEAIDVDPEYPDARVFNAILLDDAQRFDEAAEQLVILDTLDAAPQIQGLVDGSGIRANVAAGQIAQRFGDGTEIDLSQVAGSPATISQAALVIESAGDVPLALRVYEAVLAIEADQIVALVGKGRWLGAEPGVFAADPELAAQGLALLDQAVETEPAVAEIRLYRALARSVQLDPEGARQDLDLIDRASLDEDLVALYDQIAAAT